MIAHRSSSRTPRCRAAVTRLVAGAKANASAQIFGPRNSSAQVWGRVCQELDRLSVGDAAHCSPARRAMITLPCVVGQGSGPRCGEAVLITACSRVDRRIPNADSDSRWPHRWPRQRRRDRRNPPLPRPRPGNRPANQWELQSDGAGGGRGYELVEGMPDGADEVVPSVRTGRRLRAQPRSHGPYYRSDQRALR